jgi:hypothetical protein
LNAADAEAAKARERGAAQGSAQGSAAKANASGGAGPKPKKGACHKYNAELCSFGKGCRFEHVCSKPGCGLEHASAVAHPETKAACLAAAQKK